MYLFYNKLIDIIIKEIIPKTKKSVLKGNKIFGAAIIDKKNLSTLVVGCNNELSNPLFHGEIVTLNHFFKLKFNNKINVSDCIFLSTHEPCSLCLSGITWFGFNNFYYFFPYSKTKTDFNIPHDLNILNKIFNIKNGKYMNKNDYWKSYSIIKEINKLNIKDREKMNIRIQKINKEYENLSKLYQKNKKNNLIPLN